MRREFVEKVETIGSTIPGAIATCTTRRLDTVKALDPEEWEEVKA